VSISDPNPHISYLTDAATKQQIAANIGQVLALADKLTAAQHPLSEDQLKRERFQAESNALAESSALYAATRSASAHHLVIPLEPNGTRPMIDVKHATNDPHKLYEWWAGEFSECNPGVALGRRGGLWALIVDDHEASERLREMAVVHRRDTDTDRSWKEDRGLGGRVVRLETPSSGKRFVRTKVAWGRQFDQILAEYAREHRGPEAHWRTYAYPSVVSGQDAFDFRSRTIAEGLHVLGEGEAMPWDGAMVGGFRVAAPFSIPPEAPLWLASKIGKPRSRKAMAAQREQYDAMQRVQGAHVAGLAELIRKAAEEAAEQAMAEAKKAARAEIEAAR
jgi:Bifunctional DNA primase/polymerase, N-terminal